eukprot:scaffold794_cov106-Skeletonema_dohrnii-CCMP3373.AAC.3
MRVEFSTRVRHNMYVDIMRQQWPCRRRRPPNPCIRMINSTNMINWFGPWLRVWGCGVSSTLAYNVKTYLSPSKFQLSIVLDANLSSFAIIYETGQSMFDEATSLTFRKVEPLKASVRSCGQLDLSPTLDELPEGPWPAGLVTYLFATSRVRIL